ncbi:hypothetical protein Mycsm_01751 [Mycobacterium sp. JS623]|uniref:hypothetical protein n=1 Tax=Mycobacterium sp. JS623 TaxID=212767 RepID=UPI0002A5A553|nr:hypothetical protein [Mycobacterium sp. JS623]AGB22144.1 hypothetical protein Mycsm_01751 [Mycobacterium sp. JS623]
MDDDIDVKATVHTVDAALREYESATVDAATDVTILLGIGPKQLSQTAPNLRELRTEIVRLRSELHGIPVTPTRHHDTSGALFGDEEAESARYLLRSAIRLAHDRAYTTRDEMAVGEIAYTAVTVYGGLSPLATRLAYADHVSAYEAVATLGRPLKVHRDFVVRCAVLGQGEALNAEYDSDVPASVAVEAWLGEARSIHNCQRRKP